MTALSYQPFLQRNGPDPNLSRLTAKRSCMTGIRDDRKAVTHHAHLFSLNIRNTFLLSWFNDDPARPFVPLGLGGNTARPHRSCKSASASLVPSVSTTIVPNHPGSTNRPFESGMGMRAVVGVGRVLAWLGGRIEIRFGGRMTNEDRFTQRTTLW